MPKMIIIMDFNEAQIDLSISWRGNKYQTTTQFDTIRCFDGVISSKLVQIETHSPQPVYEESKSTDSFKPNILQDLLIPYAPASSNPNLITVPHLDQS